MSYNIMVGYRGFAYYLDDQGTMQKWIDFGSLGPSYFDLPAEKVLDIIFHEKDKLNGRFVYCKDWAKDFELHEGMDIIEDFQKNPFVFLQVKEIDFYDHKYDEDNSSYAERPYRGLTLYNFDEYDFKNLEKFFKNILDNKIEIPTDKWHNINDFFQLNEYHRMELKY